MRIPDIELVSLLTAPRTDVAILRMVVADVELLALAGLHVILVDERMFVWGSGVSHALLSPASAKI